MSASSSQSESATPATTQLHLWSPGPRICNVDTQMMPHYNFQAVCNHEGCAEVIPFTAGLGKDMRKHHNDKHRVLCKACKKDNFRTQEALDEHLKSDHGGSLCSECHASFNLTSAVAMHIESSKNSCSVTTQALASALKRIRVAGSEKKDGTGWSMDDINCSPEEIISRFRKLKEFRGTLLRAHKEALKQKQQQETKLLPLSNIGRLRFNKHISVNDPSNGRDDQSFSNTFSNADHPNTPSASDTRSISALTIRDEQSRFDEGKFKWTCSYCTVNFTSLSKLLQHIEGRAKDDLWKSLN